MGYAEAREKRGDLGNVSLNDCSSHLLHARSLMTRSARETSRLLEEIFAHTRQKSS